MWNCTVQYDYEAEQPCPSTALSDASRHRQGGTNSPDERPFTMYQAQMIAFGGPEVLRLIEKLDPQPGPDQVVVATEASGVTFVDTQIRAGRPPQGVARPTLPLVLGNAVEGRVTVVGSTLDNRLLGSRVVTATGGSGGYADRVVVSADVLTPVPKDLPLGAAVAVLADGRTALALMRATHVTAGDTVLVLAAAGGVGSLILQLARSAGVAHLVAAARGAEKLSLATDLGADIAIDYDREGWERQILEHTAGVDVVFDGVGGELGARALDLIRPGARFAVYGAASGQTTDANLVAAKGAHLIQTRDLVRSLEDNRELVQEALRRAAIGELRPVVGQTYPLSRASDAHLAIEMRQTIGKTILVPDG